MVSPPAVLTATRPRAPSDPVPESTTVSARRSVLSRYQRLPGVT